MFRSPDRQIVAIAPTVGGLPTTRLAAFTSARWMKKSHGSFQEPNKASSSRCSRRMAVRSHISRAAR